MGRVGRFERQRCGQRSEPHPTSSHLSPERFNMCLGSKGWRWEVGAEGRIAHERSVFLVPPSGEGGGALSSPRTLGVDRLPPFDGAHRDPLERKVRRRQENRRVAEKGGPKYRTNKWDCAKIEEGPDKGKCDFRYQWCEPWGRRGREN